MTQYRRGAGENALYVRTDVVTGKPVKLRADAFGVIPIETPEERRVADAFGLRVTRLPRMTAEEITETNDKKERR
jgi:hypothetical protein